MRFKALRGMYVGIEKLKRDMNRDEDKLKASEERKLKLNNKFVRAK